MYKTPRPFNQPTNLKTRARFARSDKHHSDLYKSSILYYCPSLIGQIYLTRLRPQQPTPSPSPTPTTILVVAPGGSF